MGVPGLGFRVQVRAQGFGFGFRGWVSEFQVWGSVFWLQDSGCCRVWASALWRFKADLSSCDHRVSGLGVYLDSQSRQQEPKTKIAKMTLIRHYSEVQIRVGAYLEPPCIFKRVLCRSSPKPL